MNVLLVVGTRPEAIKLAPVYHALVRAGVNCRVCMTGQHREMASEPLSLFGIEPVYKLNIEHRDQSLHLIAAGVLSGLYWVIANAQPDWIVVQGDTTSALAGAMAGFYSGIQVAHIEAGLRTGDRYAPYPEEANRRAITQFTNLHLAPTERARHNLEAEGISSGVHVTGNTVVDALEILRERVVPAEGRYILVTAHRRENHARVLQICSAVRRLAEEMEIIFSVHPNPAVRAQVNEQLEGVHNVRLLDPVIYLDFLGLMAGATLILTDSGGIQEEAPSFGVPVVVLREVTERPEAIESGFAKLAGTDPERICETAHEMLQIGQLGGRASPFGDGRAAERIARILVDCE